MREFESMAEFCAHLATLAAAEAVALHKGLDGVMQHMENTAKAEIGHYQEAVGPFPEWAPLADSTEAEKARLGYPADAPLLREGDLEDSITHETHGFEGVMGSTSKIMEYQEFGTEHIPPRPVIGPAAYVSQDKVQEIVGGAAIAGLVGKDPVHPSLGYDMLVSGTK